MESANVNFDEYTKVHDVEPIKRTKEYRSFVYFYEGMPTKEGATNPIVNQQQVLVSIELQPVNVKLHSDAKL